MAGDDRAARPPDVAGGGTTQTTTGRTETAPDVIAARASTHAGADLRAPTATRRTDVGRVHQAVFREQTLGESGIGPLEWYFNKGPVRRSPGAAGAVRNNYYRTDRVVSRPGRPDVRARSGPASLVRGHDAAVLQAADRHGPTVDGAADRPDDRPERQPGDSHYGDLIDDWAAGTTVPFPFTDQAVAGLADEAPDALTP